MPTLYSFREHVEDFGLISYGIDLRESTARAASYVDRILKGEKPTNLPVKIAKVELVINLKTAKTLGVAMPLPLLGRADLVIE